MAAEAGSERMVTLLMSRGARVDLVSRQNMTPVDTAREADHETCAALILSMQEARDAAAGHDRVSNFRGPSVAPGELPPAYDAVLGWVASDETVPAGGGEAGAEGSVATASAAVATATAAPHESVGDEVDEDGYPTEAPPSYDAIAGA